MVQYMIMIYDFLSFQTELTDLPYTNPILDHGILQTWATDKCVPLVREITFENAEVSTSVKSVYKR